jgi:HSP90 family molecular chaperone
MYMNPFTPWSLFTTDVKIGIIEDDKARDDLVPLLRFYSSHSANDSQVCVKPTLWCVY